MAEDTRPLSQSEIERVLRYYRSYYLLHDHDGNWLNHTKRAKIMDDDSIRFTAEEFVAANRSGVEMDALNRRGRHEQGEADG